MTDLQLTRALAAGPERVWHALTDPEELAAWFWPPSFQTSVDSELRPSGRYRIASDAMGMAVAGEFELVDPGRAVSFTWHWDGEDHASLVTYDLAPSDSGTTLTVTHSALIDETDRDNHIQGWSDCLDRLPDYLATRPQ